MSLASKIVLLAVLIVLSLLFLLPIWSVLVTSLTPEGEIFMQGMVFWPNHPTISNFRGLFERYPYLKWYRNSIIVSTFFVIGQMISCSMTAFGLAHFNFRGRGLILIVVLATLMLPFHVLMIPMFLLMKNLGWINTLLPLFVPAFFGDITGAVGIFLLRQAFMGIPRDFAEAAYIDGANPLDVFVRVFLPLIRSYLAVLLLLSFMISWNDLVRPLVYISDVDVITVTGGLAFFQTEWRIEWGPVMAGTMMAIMPAMIGYIFLQRYFVKVALTLSLIHI